MAGGVVDRAREKGRKGGKGEKMRRSESVGEVGKVKVSERK